MDTIISVYTCEDAICASINTSNASYSIQKAQNCLKRADS